MATAAPTAPQAQPATDRINVLITGSDIGPEKLADEVRSLSPRLHVTVLPNREALPELAAAAEVIAGSLSPACFPRQRTSSGCTPGPPASTSPPRSRPAPSSSPAARAMAPSRWQSTPSC
jgi:hypothetical protein